MASVLSLQFLLLQCSNIRSTPSSSSCCYSNSSFSAMLSSSTSTSTSSSSLNNINKRGSRGGGAGLRCKSTVSVMYCLQKKSQSQSQSQGLNYSTSTSIASSTTTTTTSVIRCCTNNESNAQQQLVAHHTTTTTNNKKRREALFQLALAAATAISSPSLLVSSSLALAADAKEDFRIYSDETNKFNIMIPQDWQVGVGPGNGIKSVTAFYPPEASQSNVSVLITGLGADFTRLESFGKVDEFAETLVSGLDRSWQRPPGVEAKLINSKASKGFYYIEYSLQNPGEGCRHIFTSIGIASNTWYNRLYTVTGQFLEEDTEKYGSKIQKSVSSFKFN